MVEGEHREEDHDGGGRGGDGRGGDGPGGVGRPTRATRTVMVPPDHAGSRGHGHPEAPHR